ncbi:UDP-Glycosyltransferase superfamily protein [Actinidia rufa]|uniref:UDP-Glycosyltransferase superfamily protein n=1 Tax=Actinidia rufa TaxID=165716 RepID=A0A7J0E0U7_9ERIC|nr:UDP-Glycosyltransferase superfamily protein [Actinidia rufa]
MGSAPQLHFVLIPLMGQGHLIPMIDMARLLAQRGVIVTIITTPVNATRFQATIDRTVDSGLPIQLVQLRFPSVEQPLEHFIENLQSPPSCMISDKYLTFTAQVAQDISDHEKFFMPGLPNQIEFTWAQLPSPFNPGSLVSPDMKKNRDRIREGELGAYGVVINSFEELEREYVERYRKAKGEKVWCIGPVVVHLCEEDKFGVLVKREDVKKAIEKVMDKGRDGQERRERARELQKMAKMAMERGGSSYTNLTLLIEDIMQQAARNQEAKTLETVSSLNLNS